MGIFDRIREGLKKTRDAVAEQAAAVFLPGHKLTDEDYETLETALLRADVGPAAAERVLEGVRKRLGDRSAEKPAEAVRAEIEAVLNGTGGGAAAGAGPRPVGAAAPHVTLVVGVNGTGKTTTIAKLANRYKAAGDSVLLVACDTFRAAASDQLQIWADRAGVPIHRQTEGADPAAVAFDGAARAKSMGVKRVIFDTAGRLHVKANLMAELEKVRRVIDRAIPGAPHETLLVLDATTGQNGLAQAREFAKAIPVTGLVLTKLDGTAKGGVALAIAETLKLPIRWVGVGEGMEDLVPFDAKEFAAALVGD
ncbi:MAG TPA: signal recognition particle-docking protein FtsY [Candidatus Limnocylindrales bacterium]|nr:signal recognition particle-docking protein FtsY [Candidatus Limnocylindrales bacterium]